MLRFYLKQLNLHSWFFGRRDPFADHIQKAFEMKQKSDDEGQDFFVTGHSLGGVTAAIVGGHSQIKSVAFSPPGEDFNLERYDINRNARMWDTLTAVVPYMD